MAYTYDHPHPALAADIALLTALEGRLSILLIERAHPPFEGRWAFPGGFMEIDETLSQCAARELAEETGVAGAVLEPVAVADAPDRDPRERVVSGFHVGVVRADEVSPRSASDAKNARWFPIHDLPDLAFDHAWLMARLRDWLVTHADPLSLALRMLPRGFTPAELVKLYGDVTGQNR